jgi:hypothetical protein
MGGVRLAALGDVHRFASPVLACMICSSPRPVISSAVLRSTMRSMRTRHLRRRALGARQERPQGRSARTNPTLSARFSVRRPAVCG